MNVYRTHMAAFTHLLMRQTDKALAVPGLGFLRDGSKDDLRIVSIFRFPMNVPGLDGMTLVCVIDGADLLVQRSIRRGPVRNRKFGRTIPHPHAVHPNWHVTSRRGLGAGGSRAPSRNHI